ncbi:uncharacterized protein F4812DRAFT_467539 [Daldinia caldariorum]|uniref:uncharacterized protein n=1 Tax=Daldinia caldariorum TaxID=326644 RepID=UPI002008B41C|nr:uncharacterized protein F4812DRAFT_467539 [Daldinia caldariorum]KAI1471481.1 hypothetical protein F4812DRAFT_467539 [Daldinia caldariorum]
MSTVSPATPGGLTQPDLQRTWKTKTFIILASYATMTFTEIMRHSRLTYSCMERAPSKGAARSFSGISWVTTFGMLIRIANDCDVCGVDFSSKTEIRNHCKENHFFCAKCNVGFTTSVAQAFHLGNSNDHFYCRKCSRDFPSPGELVKHYTTSSSWAPGIVHHYCQVCHSDFTDNEHLRNHYLSSDIHNYCYLCNKHMGSKAELRQHYINQKATHGYCESCQIPFKSKEDYIQHAIQNPKSHAYCQQCHEAFATQAALDTHKSVSTAHHYCEKCNMDFEESLSLQLHLEEGHPTCNICLEFFRSSHSLNEHKSFRHAYKCCRACSRCYPDGKSLKEHMQNSHHYCQRCDRVFETYTSLKSHSMESDQHHACSTCGFDAKDIESLEQHVFYGHYYCKVCEQTFVSSAALQNHLNQSNEHYYCSQCEHDFDDAQTLATHIEHQHNCHHESDNKECLENHISSCYLKVIPQGKETATREEMVNKEVTGQNPNDEVSRGEECDDGEIADGDSRSSESQEESSGIMCFVCPKRFPSRLAMVNHCEEGDCREGFYQAIYNEDKSKEFTTDSVKMTFTGMGRFKCPQPYCGDLFSKFSGLIDHLEALECGAWLEKRREDELSYLKSYLS